MRLGYIRHEPNKGYNGDIKGTFGTFFGQDMTKPIRKIAFLVDKNEFNLLKKACLYGADADKNLEKAVKEGDKYHLEFSYEELDDLAGYVANCANDEESERKQEKWDNLADKIEGLLKLSDNMKKLQKHTIAFPKQPCGLKHYIFDIWIAGRGGVCDSKDKVLRKIQIAGTKSLYNFARVITQAFGFYFDHCFGFYDNFQRYHDSKKAYELFVDIGEEPSKPWIKGVKKTKISQVFKNPGDKMLFLFDYGDCWYFAVELKEIRNAEKRDLKPVILESIGKAPMQYPPCEEEGLGDE